VANGLVDLDADGTGAFLGEGEFTLSLRLAGILPQQPNTSNIQVKVSGTSALSCSDAGGIVVTLTGAGSSSKLGDLQVQFSHEIGSAGCA
jgi:hypothetical protein